VIHLVLFLTRLGAYIRSTRVRKNVTVVLLHELDTSTWSEDRLAALSYALRGPESDLEAEAAVETEAEDVVEEEEPSLQEISPFLASVGKLFKNVKSALLGPKTPSRGEEEEEDEFTALLSADNQDTMEAEGTGHTVFEGDIDLDSRAGTASTGVVVEYIEPPVPESIDKPLPPPPSPVEDGNGDGNHV
jgi:hypothetical protein